MTAYYMDLWLRYFEARKIAEHRVVLMDRFFYDGLALARQRYVPLFRDLTPKIKKCFFLYADPKIISKRKKEATPQNMIDYRKRVEKDMMGHFNIVKVDTSMPLNKVLDQIEKEMEK